MERIDIQAGDVFCSSNPWVVGRLILAAERLISRDGAAEFGHAGIIADRSGRTIEALNTVRYGHLVEYAGKPVLIYRPARKWKPTGGEPITTGEISSCIDRITADHTGDVYPAWRLLLHLVPPLARMISDGRHVVCSELVAKYLACLEARHHVWAGANPDNLADEWHTWENFDLVYEGILPEGGLWK